MTLPPFVLEGMARTVRRAPINPLDKCTIVSIYPRRFHVSIPTVQPCEYQIAPSSYDNPGVLVVTSASYWENRVDRPSLEIPIASPTVAENMVNDYIKNLNGYEAGIADPGIFYVLGEKTSEQVKKDHKDLLDAAKVRQKNWFNNLVQGVDVLWARTNGNPKVIDDLARLAALELGLKNKAWLQDFQTMQMTPCSACGTLRNPVYPVCPNCKTDHSVKK